MATATRRTLVANPAKRRRKRNGSKKLSAKQIKFFGTARQKAALKASRKRKRKNRPVAKHRKRTVAKSNPVRRRAPKRNAARKSSHRKRAHRRRSVRKNFGEIVSLVNPAKRRSKSMAKARRRRKTTATRRHARRVHRRNGRRTHRRNPMGGSFGGDVVEVLYMIGGGVGSKLLTQVALGSSNSGILGYLGNLAAGGILAWGTKALLKNPKAARDVFKGAILQVVLRAITDYTPFGSYTSQLGMGDYMASNWVTPQRYTDALNSANVEIPAGWGGGVVVASSGVNADAMGAGNPGGGGMF